MNDVFFRVPAQPWAWGVPAACLQRTTVAAFLGNARVNTPVRLPSLRSLRQTEIPTFRLFMLGGLTKLHYTKCLYNTQLHPLSLSEDAHSIAAIYVATAIEWH